VSAVTRHGEAVSIAVKVHPRAKRDGISGMHGDAVKLDLAAAPVDGRANEACIRYLATLLKVPRSAVSIATGESSRKKVVRVTGVTVEQVQAAIDSVLAGQP
jgi:uncharacterized protein (TIGR00251 family)